MAKQSAPTKGSNPPKPEVFNKKILVAAMSVAEVEIEEKRREGKHRRLMELKYAHEALKDQATARAQRIQYADQVYALIVLWLFAICLVILLAGFGGKYVPFKLSDAVLLALIGGTTLNVLGLFVIVMKHLFPTNSVIKEKPENSINTETKEE